HHPRSPRRGPEGEGDAEEIDQGAGERPVSEALRADDAGRERLPRGGPSPRSLVCRRAGDGADVPRRNACPAEARRRRRTAVARITRVNAAALQPLAPDSYRELVRRALAEDVGAGDITTKATVDDTHQARAVLLAKSRCVVAGLDVAAEAFRQLDSAVAIR